jgi:hypothetical protein
MPRQCDTRILILSNSVTLMTTQPSRLMAGGSTSRLAVVHASTSSWLLGHPRWTPKNALAVF